MRYLTPLLLLCSFACETEGGSPSDPTDTAPGALDGAVDATPVDMRVAGDGPPVADGAASPDARVSPDGAADVCVAADDAGGGADDASEVAADAAEPTPDGSVDPLCNDLCPTANDGECDDGGPGAAFAVCALGSDCGDCGARADEPDAAPDAGILDAAPDAPVDLCLDVACPAPEPGCVDGDVVGYAGDGVCDPETGECDFTAVRAVEPCRGRGLACVDAACVDLCADVDCAAPEPRCEADVAVRYSGDGRCVRDTGECDFAAVAEREACGPDRVCQDAACVDLCAEAACPAPVNACEGNTLVRYSGPGICVPATGRCDFTAVVERDDCTEEGQVCDRAACIEDVVAPPGPGELVITEIMANPAAVDDVVGEWFEVHNTTNRTLDLNGLVVSDDGRDEFVVATPDGEPLELGPRGWLVFGASADGAANGGVPVDVVFSNYFTLANAGDEVSLSAAGQPIDRVVYGGAGFAVPRGASLQLDADLGFGVDNELGGAWCPTTAVYGAGDRGTPGGPNEGCGDADEVTIPMLRDPDDPERVAPGTRVRLSGVVLSGTDGARAAWVQEEQPGPFAGIYVSLGANVPDELTVGDRVNVTGAYDEVRGRSTVAASRVELMGPGQAPVPHVVSVAVLASIDTAEPYEGLLVAVEGVSVTESNPDAPRDFGEFSVEGLRVDDLLYQTIRPVEGTAFDAVVGPLDYTFGAHKLVPRSRADLVGRTNPGLTPVEAEIRLFDVFPDPVEVLVRNPVRWTNRDRAAHTVTSGRPGDADAGALFDSGPLRQGDRFEYTPRFARNTEYFCRAHPDLSEGRLLVVRPECPEACDRYSGCVQSQPNCQADQAGRAFAQGACDATCEPGGHVTLSCEPLDAVGQGICETPLCERLCEQLDGCGQGGLLGLCVQFCEAAPDNLFRCMGEHAQGSVDGATLCEALDACGGLLGL